MDTSTAAIFQPHKIILYQTPKENKQTTTTTKIFILSFIF
jgi:hypothetical protein